jgi:hypothetical protein
MKQQNFENTNWKLRNSYGGSLRKKRAGRKARPLSSRNPIHFFIRAPRRAEFSDFFRVFAGQVAQQFEKEGLLSRAVKQKVTDTASRSHKASKSLLRLWKHRPFTMVVVGWKAYQKDRLRGTLIVDWDVLWN